MCLTKPDAICHAHDRMVNDQPSRRVVRIVLDSDGNIDYLGAERLGIVDAFE